MQSLSLIGSTQICPHLNVQKAVAVGLLATIGTIAYTKFSDEIGDFFASQIKSTVGGSELKPEQKKQEPMFISFEELKYEEWKKEQEKLAAKFNKNGVPVIPVDPRECQTTLEGYGASAEISKISDAVGGKEKFCALPVLQWKASFRLGAPCTIDGVRPSDLSAPLMRGSDPAMRPYLTLRTEDTLRDDSSIPAEKGAQILFQRYTDMNSHWTSGHHRPGRPMDESTVDKVELERLKALAAGKSIEMPRWDGKVVIKKLA